MIDLIRETLRPLLPMRIDRAEYQDPSLLLGGAGWSLAITCPWTLAGTEGPVTNWEADDVEDACWDLIGHEIVAVDRREDGNVFDPAFELTEGLQLRIFADTDLDPWVLHLPTITFVGRQHRPDDPPT